MLNPHFSKTEKSRKSDSNTFSASFVSWSIPAGFSGKERTCPNMKDCAVGCYAKMGNYNNPDVQTRQKKNYNLSRSDEFVPIMISSIQQYKSMVSRTYRALAFRIHDAGDFYSPEYLMKWDAIMKAHPDVQFYAYTKMVSMIKAYERGPYFIPIYSIGGVEDHLIDRQKDRHSRVFKNLEDLKASGYVDASDDDGKAIWSSKKVGLIWHGNHVNKIWESIA